ncbi:hypothetical protein DFR24_4137 [Panacagrimonas perspica]|uniref:SnoaL-like protein n=1 Tax=Panacagrimonas perspica TaxID=381431 RepID=A0A4S3JYT1_9GAMM|nr:hypothetical protein [Panacagrimonas perspica]TDU25692.1 hypothetical protein DFR24_4137 [Panacagrimonas perspica]THD00743.1 hypothetical protein B1810_23435 [Panacagrimonas perspica]
MGKFVLFVMLAGGGAWWYFVGGRTLTEDHVKAFYAEQTRATLNRNPEALCDMLASDFHGTAVSISLGGRKKIEQNRGEACSAYHEFYDAAEALGEKMGGMVVLEYDQRITKLELAADRRSATVKTRFTFDIGGALINLRGTSTDTLERRNGKVRLSGSDGQVTTSSGIAG